MVHLNNNEINYHLHIYLTWITLFLVFYRVITSIKGIWSDNL